MLGICQFGQTGKTDQFKIIRACYKKITYNKLKWDKVNKQTNYRGLQKSKYDIFEFSSISGLLTSNQIKRTWLESFESAD